MENIEYLFAGFAVFWGGLFVYLLTLQTRLRGLHREIERLEERLAQSEGSSTARSRTVGSASSATSGSTEPSAPPANS